MKINCILACVFLVGTFAGGCRMYQEIQQHRNRVYNDLKSICDAIPIPENLVLTGSQELIKPDRGSYANNYETSLACSAAKEPFYAYVRSQGWTPTKKGIGYYYRDNYLFDVTCEPISSFSKKNRVQVSCSWDQYGEGKEIY